MPVTIHSLCPLLQVFDMPKSLAFYRDQLGFQIVNQDRPGDDCDWVLLRWDAAELMLNTAFEVDERPDEPDIVRMVAHTDTTLYLNTPDLDLLPAQLQQRGVTFVPPVVREYGMKQLMLHDPDGFGICFQWPETVES